MKTNYTVRAENRDIAFVSIFAGQRFTISESYTAL